MCTQRVVNAWNSLPGHVVETKSLMVFKVTVGYTRLSMVIKQIYAITSHENLFFSLELT